MWFVPAASCSPALLVAQFYLGGKACAQTSVRVWHVSSTTLFVSFGSRCSNLPAHSDHRHLVVHLVSILSCIMDQEVLQLGAVDSLGKQSAGVCPGERKGEPALTLHGEQSCLNIDQWGSLWGGEPASCPRDCGREEEVRAEPSSCCNRSRSSSILWRPWTKNPCVDDLLHPPMCQIHTHLTIFNLNIKVKKDFLNFV